MKMLKYKVSHTGHGRSVGREAALDASGPETNPMSGTFFHIGLVMKIFLRPFCLFR